MDDGSSGAAATAAAEAVRSYWLCDTGTGRCVLAAEVVQHCIEQAVVRGLPTAGPRFDAVLVYGSDQLVPAIDLRARRGGAQSGGTDALLLRQQRTVALIVDRVIGSLSLAATQIHALSAAQREQLPDYVAAVTFLDSQPVAVLDADRLCAEDELPDRAATSRRLDRRKVPRGPRS